MQYRQFGKDKFNVSVLGFGAMRLPILNNDMKQIDQKLATAMIRRGIDGGINYVDTAYPYHGGTSEALVGQALKGGYREKVRLADKMPTWLVNSRDDMDRLLAEQLARLDDKRIDYYLLHSLNRGVWNKMKELGVLRWAKKQMSKGTIGSLGFSFHGPASDFIKICDDHDWDFCQIQYNYMDTATQAGLKGLKHAASRGISVIVMEPLKGGRLALPPEQVKAILENGKGGSPVSWALRWVWNDPKIPLLLSGMSTMEQVEENLKIAYQAQAGSFSAEELKTIDRVRSLYNRMVDINCTNCKYCLPCPSGVNIPRNFELYNDGYRYGNFGNPAFFYWNWFKPSERAENCINCGICENRCPQAISIRAELKKVREALAKK
jgi:predicted aldo/keto reductase-like oxidoreductase